MPDGSTIGYILCFVLLIIASAFFSASEMALSSVNKIHIMTAAESGNKKAKRTLNLTERFEETLTVLLISNNIVNISCATLATVVASKIASQIEGLDQATVITAATFIITVIIILFGEIVPKNFGKSCSEKFIMAASGILVFISSIIKPLSILFTAISNGITKIIMKNSVEEPTVTEAELIDMVESLPDSPSDFDEDTAKLVNSALKFSDATVSDILIPWEKVSKVFSGIKTEQLIEVLKQSNHSRLPVVGRDGEVKGILRIRSYFKAYIAKRKNIVLASVMDRPFYCYDDINLDEILQTLSRHRRNLAIVRNRDDKILGIITVEDVLETLVGNIFDESDQEAVK